VEHVLFFVQHAGTVPVLAELGAASQVGNREDASMLQPEIAPAGKSGREAHVESAVTGKQRGVLAVELKSFFVKDEHRNLGAVLRRVPDLANFKCRRINARRGYFVPQRRLTRGQLDLVDGRRNRERLESEERFFAIPVTAESLNRADAREFHVAQRFAIEVEKLEL